MYLNKIFRMNGRPLQPAASLPKRFYENNFMVIDTETDELGFKTWTIAPISSKTGRVLKSQSLKVYRYDNPNEFYPYTEEVK